MSVARYLHTIMHLRPVQVYGRVLYRIRRPAVDLRPAPPLRRPEGPWLSWTWREPALRGSDRFRFLEVEHSIEGAPSWDDPAHAKLWRYNLHYFDELTSTRADERRMAHRTLVGRWCTEVPWGVGTGWEPYPTSLRIVNWIKAEFDTQARGTALLDGTAVHSLAVQLRWLRGRLESHLLGNHLWANAKALLVGGLWFGGDEADAWRRQGARLMTQAIREQVLPDGGHFERSPMYHATMTEDVLDLLRFAAAYPSSFPADLRRRLAEVAPRMLRWLRVMTHSDGDIALFNDAAFGIAPRHAQLEALAHQLGFASDDTPLAAFELLPASGYARLTLGRAVVICDAAPLGPDYLPAHGHADTLSYEFSLDGARLLVNGGTSVYEEGATRDRERGTAAHNTVVVDGRNSSDVWRSFRVGARARPRIVEGGASDDRVWFAASHDGYRGVFGGVTHTRRWSLGRSRLEIHDALVGHYRSASSVLRTPLDASLLPSGRIGLGTGCEVSCSSRCELRADSWSPVFGLPRPAYRIDAPVERGRLETVISWQ